jgi:Ser/Thr protein kinase RdoA (MazF antagonist)
MSPEDWAYLQKQVSSLDCELPDAVYHSLPRHVIHGDYHPANLRFDGDAVTGVYDLDWCTVQPRARDLADGLIFFAGLRDGDVTSSDIRKLTRTWTHCPERAAAFLLAYERTGPITGHERALLPSFMRARWLHCRIIGRSKVPPQDGVTFFLDGLLEPLRSLGAANPLPEAD